MKRQGFTLIELLVVLAIIAIVLSLLIGGCSMLVGSSSVGSRTGVVQKFSKKGVGVKTYEGELALAGFGGAHEGKGGGSQGNVWAFSVDSDDTNLVSALKKLDSRYFVRVHYTEVVVNASFYDTPYRVQAIEVLEVPEHGAEFEIGQVIGTVPE
jgi:prepilin-type N-terminal cleavage/methylation domain-containing protein